MTTIALFDIDGTLLRAGGAGRKAVERALAELIGRTPQETSLEAVKFAGRTDPWIVTQALAHYGVEYDEVLVDEIIARYVVHLPGELERSAQFEVLPGVRALLAMLRDELGLMLGLGTGNVEPAAYAKLRRGNLDGFFHFGGFGCDHVERARVLGKGRERGLAHHGVEEARVVVIGDTPHDVAAAHAIDAYAVAVCTGRFDATTLRDAGAHLVVDDLEDAQVRAVFHAS
ncbi:MAG: HAD family hydrolase [Myxococcota bacterium]